MHKPLSLLTFLLLSTFIFGQNETAFSFDYGVPVPSPAYCRAHKIQEMRWYPIPVADTLEETDTVEAPVVKSKAKYTLRIVKDDRIPAGIARFDAFGNLRFLQMPVGGLDASNGRVVVRNTYSPTGNEVTHCKQVWNAGGQLISQDSSRTVPGKMGAPDTTFNWGTSTSASGQALPLDYTCEWFERDSKGRKAQFHHIRTDSNGNHLLTLQTSQLAYNDAGQLVREVVDPSSIQANFDQPLSLLYTYDVMGMLVEVSGKDCDDCRVNLREIYSYHENGNLVEYEAMRSKISIAYEHFRLQYDAEGLLEKFLEIEAVKGSVLAEKEAPRSEKDDKKPSIGETSGTVEFSFYR